MKKIDNKKAIEWLEEQKEIANFFIEIYEFEVDLRDDYSNDLKIIDYLISLLKSEVN